MRPRWLKYQLVVSCFGAICAVMAILHGSSAQADKNDAPGFVGPPPQATVVSSFDPAEPREVPVPAPSSTPGQVAAVSPGAIVTRGSFTSVQVNVNAQGNNILGDAANEPTIAVDPTNLARMAIAWRQFDTTASNFREAGMAHTVNSGASWTMQTLQNGVFRSDPVLGFDSSGAFFFSSLSTTTSVELFRSLDGGATWLGPVVAHGGDKQWITVDRTGGIGDGNIYQIWNAQFSCCGTTDFARSLDGGLSFQAPRAMPLPKLKWGTLDVGPNGTLYIAGSSIDQSQHLFLSSANAQNAAVTPTFSAVSAINLGGTSTGGGPNPGGLLGQVWIATDHSDGLMGGNIYVLGSVDPPGEDPLDVMFIRSTDGGMTWSQPVRINDDPGSSLAWQWFGTMSVAPTGRIDVVWNDTRNDELTTYSELYHSASIDGGLTWSPNVAITPPFNHFLGYPDQNKIGDYYHMVSDAGGANLAYAATFNGEQDVYYVRIPGDCNLNGVEDSIDIANDPDLDCSGNGFLDQCEPNCNGNDSADSCDIFFGVSDDCTDNGIPDECEPDCNDNNQADVCEIHANPALDQNDNGFPDECEQILYVRQGAAGKHNGLTWGDAYDNLQAALIHAALPPRVVSQIWVAAGTYIPSSGSRTESFQLQDNLFIFGGFAGNESILSQRNWRRNPTILSGDIAGDDQPALIGRADNSFHVVRCEKCGDAAVLDGFVITGGNATGNAEHQNGGGIFIVDGAPFIQNCTITDNHVFNQGGGVYASSAQPVFISCVIARNHAFEASALYLTRSSNVTLQNCTVSHNRASGFGAAAGDFGGTILESDSSILWGNTDFSGSKPEDVQITGIGSLAIDYSIVEGWTGQYGGVENSGNDPLLFDVNGEDDMAGTLDDDFRLTVGSPAINSGTPQSAYLLATDLDGHPRILCGALDRGAYEFGIGDYNCDQVVDLKDIGYLPGCVLGPENLVASQCRAFDVDADWDVDLFDLALLQVLWSD